MTTQNGRSEGESDRLQSVRRAFALLEALAARPGGATPKELSQALGLHLSTCYRLLNTLVSAGYAAHSASSGLFRLGPRIAYLHNGYVAALQPHPATLPFVHTLQLATGETAMFNHLEGDDVVVTATVAGSRPDSHPPGYAGMAIPAHVLAAGRVLLAGLPAAQFEAHLTRCVTLAGIPPFPATTPAVLREELARIRLAGYALDRGEGNPNVCCVSAPVSDGAGVVGSIATVAPCARFRREEQTLVAVNLEVARAIGALLTGAAGRDEPTVAGQDEPEEVVQAAMAARLMSVAESMSRVG